MNNKSLFSCNFWNVTCFYIKVNENIHIANCAAYFYKCYDSFWDFQLQKWTNRKRLQGLYLEMFQICKWIVSFKQCNAQVTYWCTCKILIRNNYGTYIRGIIKESSKGCMLKVKWWQTLLCSLIDSELIKFWHTMSN